MDVFFVFLPVTGCFVQLLAFSGEKEEEWGERGVGGVNGNGNFIQ